MVSDWQQVAAWYQMVSDWPRNLQSVSSWRIFRKCGWFFFGFQRPRATQSENAPVRLRLLYEPSNGEFGIYLCVLASLKCKGMQKALRWPGERIIWDCHLFFMRMMSGRWQLQRIRSLDRGAGPPMRENSLEARTHR